MAKPKNVARDYDSILEFIDNLPPVDDGFVRVFRGQTRHYGKILPTAFRAPLRGRPQWYATALRIAQRLAGAPRAPEYDSERVAGIVENEGALQHYGIGSEYLDVTHDVAIALWFALHSPSESEQEFLFGHAGTDDPLSYIAKVTSFARHEEPGVLYVFDVEDWQGRPRSHGRLFDLSSIAENHLQSERSRRQSGCLVYAQNDGDLSAFLAAEPLHVGWPLEGAPQEVFADTEYIFPPPEEDPILDALLRFPLVLDLSESSGGSGVLQHPLNLRVYDPSSWSEYEDRLHSLSMPMVLPALLGHGDQGAVEEGLVDAVPIQMEAPMVAIRGTASWNDEHLLDSLADETTPRRGASRRAPKRLDLRNVFVEFSPLEIDRWLDPEDEFVVPRALWLRRDRGEIRVDALAQLYRGSQAMDSMRFGPYSVSGGRDGRLKLQPLGGDKGKDLQAWTAGLLRPVLALLRDLNPEETPYAYKVGLVGGGQTIELTPEVGQIAELVPAAHEYLGVRYYLAKELDSDDPYTGYL